MNKAEFISYLAESNEISKKAAGEALELVLDGVGAVLADGDNLKLHGFGNFEIRKRNERKGRNPQTGEEIVIPATQAPAFKPAKTLKDKVKK